MRRPDLTSSQEHSKITTILRTTISGKDWNPWKKTFSSIKKEPQQDRRRSWYAMESNPILTLGGQHTHWRIILPRRFPPQDWEFWAPHQAPWPGVQHEEDKPPEHLAFWASRAYFRESQGAGENKDFTLKGHTKSDTFPGPRTEEVIWEEPGSDVPTNLGESPRELRGNWSSPWQRHCHRPLGELLLSQGLWCWWAATVESFLYLAY